MVAAFQTKLTPFDARRWDNCEKTCFFFARTHDLLIELDIVDERSLVHGTLRICRAVREGDDGEDEGDGNDEGDEDEDDEYEDDDDEARENTSSINSVRVQYDRAEGLLLASLAGEFDTEALDDDVLQDVHRRVHWLF